MAVFPRKDYSGVPVLACASTVLVVMLLSAGAAAQDEPGEPAQEATLLRGFVSDRTSGQRLVGANVTLLAQSVPAVDSLRVVRGTASDEQGFYQLPQVAPGRYLLRVSYVGFVPAVDTLHLGSEAIVRRNVSLVPAEEARATVTVEAEGGAADVEAGRQRIRPVDLRRVPTPGPTGDLASYLQTLPGVVSLGDRGGQFYIRGGAPSQNQVMMDKMLLYRPFHIVGFFSAFPQDLISSVDFYAGGFPARYSERLSSVVDVTMRTGNDQRYGAALSASPFLSSVRVEGPIREGRTSLLASVRQSTIERLAPSLLGQDLPLTFGEQMFKIQDTASSGQCSLTGLHTYDRGRIDPARDDVFKWQNYALGGRCLTFSSRSPLTLEVDFGLSAFRNEVGGAGGSSEGPVDVRTSSIWRLYTNVDLVRPLGRAELRWGFRVRTRRMDYTLQERFQGLESAEEFFISTGTYGGARVTLQDGRVDLNPSLSLTAPLGEGLSIQPRLRVAWRPFGQEAQQLSGAVGLYQQLLTGVSDERDAGSVFTAWMPASVQGARPRALHVVLGWRQRVAPPLNASVEGYYRRLTNLPVPIWDTNARFTTTLDEAAGTVYGLDARFTYDRRPFYLYMGYGLSWTRYGLDRAEFGRWFGEPVQTYHPPHDQRHSLSAVASYERGPWQASLRWQYGSGRPYTPPIGFDAWFDLRTLSDVRTRLGHPRFLFRRPYGERLPAYHRLDASVERTFSVDPFRLRLKAGAVNMYDRRNVFYLDLFTFRRVDQLPVVPYLALTLET